MGDPILCFSPQGLEIQVEVLQITSGMPQNFGVSVQTVDVKRQAIWLKVFEMEKDPDTQCLVSVDPVSLVFDLQTLVFCYQPPKEAWLDSTVEAYIAISPVGEVYYAEVLVLNVKEGDKSLALNAPILLATVVGQKTTLF